MSTPVTIAARYAPLLTWWRAIVAAASMVAAGSIAWTVLTSRVEAQGARLDAHGAAIQSHGARLDRVEGGQKDALWLIYIVCTRQAEQMGLPATDCSKPVR